MFRDPVFIGFVLLLFAEKKASIRMSLLIFNEMDLFVFELMAISMICAVYLN